MTTNRELTLPETIESKIFSVRGKSVMFDSHLAELYGVSVKALNQAVKRNIERFPSNFMFRLERTEWELLRSQFVTFNRDSRKFLPYAFTEQGVAMLSSVLKSKRAIAINIAIINTFVAMRQYALKLQGNDRVNNRLLLIEKALLSTDKRVDDIIKILNAMFEEGEKKEVKKIGFV